MTPHVFRAEMSHVLTLSQTSICWWCPVYTVFVVSDPQPFRHNVECVGHWTHCQVLRDPDIPATLDHFNFSNAVMKCLLNYFDSPASTCNIQFVEKVHILVSLRKCRCSSRKESSLPSGTISLHHLFGRAILPGISTSFSHKRKQTLHLGCSNLQYTKSFAM